MTLTPTETASAFRLATAPEIDEVRSILQAEGQLGPEHRIAYLGLLEPPRSTSAAADGPAERRFRVFIHDVSGAAPRDVIVSLTHRKVSSVVVLDTAVTGELPVLEEEFEVVESLLPV